VDEVTRILDAIDNGDSNASQELLPLVYDQLRRIAQQRMAEERVGHTLQATALVHEAYLRLVGDRQVPWQSRAHYFVAAAEAMRRILIEHARGRARKKRGGEGGTPLKRVPLNVLDLATEGDPEEILMLDDGICRLEEEDPEAGRIVRLRFFAGLSVDETAAALGISPSSVDREWAYARARLQRLLHE
jgi:RNA polymerase sigma factor (TIGR02999 family)